MTAKEPWMQDRAAPHPHTRKGSRMTFRKHGVAALAATAAVAMSLSGCGAGGNGGEAEAKLSDGDVTITLNWWGSDARVKLTEAAVDRFEQANPNIHVQTVYSDPTGAATGTSCPLPSPAATPPT